MAGDSSRPPAPSRGAPGRTHGLNAGFNAALAGGARADRIFAYHVGRMRCSRVLDVGANSGQFAQRMREFGYDGVIYSVEPLRSAHQALRERSGPDPRWIPLPRQAVGRARARLDLNVAANGWSSSLLPVHANHLRAEPTTRTIGCENVAVTPTCEVLRPGLVERIDALKIDVQGFESEVLAGFAPLLGSVRVLLLELSLVECYEGAPDLFAMDRLLVSEYGFTRASLEPSYYDDTLGVAQQYDGVYVRSTEQWPSEREALGVEFATLVTSMHGTPERRDARGTDLGPGWQQLCAESWGRVAPRVVSVAESEPPLAGIEWRRCPERPTLAELFDFVALECGGHAVLANADIALGSRFASLTTRLDPDTVYVAHRIELESGPEGDGSLVGRAAYLLGFDLLVVPPDFARFVASSRLLPAAFRIGEPWWDYLVPMTAMALGFPVKRLPVAEGHALHLAHAPRYSREKWLDNGALFLATLDELRRQPDCRAVALLEDICTTSGDLGTRLDHVSRIVCTSIP